MARLGIEKTKMILQNVGQDPQMVCVEFLSDLQAHVPLVFLHTLNMQQNVLKMTILKAKLHSSCHYGYNAMIFFISFPYSLSAKYFGSYQH